MADIQKVGDNIYAIDDNLYQIPRSGSVYFLAEEKKALIDTGPGTSANVVLEGIRQLGFRPDEVDYLVITHIHLDHAGGAGTLLKEMPRARVVVHPRAVKHLIDPSRLLESSVAAQGPEVLARNGEVLAIDAQRLAPVTDGAVVRLGRGQDLTIIHAPGHASHEICVLESRNRGLFAGDAVGHYLAGTNIMVPVTPPSSFDLELYLQTLARLMQLEASRIYFAHSDTSEDVRARLEAAAEELRARDSIIAQTASEGRLDTAAEKVIAHICAGLERIKKEMPLVYDYWTQVDIPMSATEHVRHFRKKHGMQD